MLLFSWILVQVALETLAIFIMTLINYDHTRLVGFNHHYCDPLPLGPHNPENPNGHPVIKEGAHLFLPLGKIKLNNLDRIPSLGTTHIQQSQRHLIPYRRGN